MAGIDGIMMIPCLLSVVTSSLIDIGISKAVCPNGQVLVGTGCKDFKGMLFPPAMIGVIIFILSVFLAAGGGAMSGIPMAWGLAPVGVSLLWSSVGAVFAGGVMSGFFNTF